ncbi:MAG: 30S ribosomal protein S17 [Nitrospinae bacterium]|nr:30S ribosomal protein S17 [Nitrospinota bacterium]
MEQERGKRKVRIGEVVSGKMQKTVMVKMEVAVPHPQYKRIVKRTKKFMAHDENQECREGDKVKIIEARPLSRHKRWRVLEVVEKAPTV